MISNKKENNFLKYKANQKKYATEISNAIIAYKEALETNQSQIIVEEEITKNETFTL